MHLPSYLAPRARKAAKAYGIRFSDFIEIAVGNLVATYEQQELKGEVRAAFAKRNENLAQRFRAKLTDFYGADKAGSVKYVEAFEVCEYGSQPNLQELKKLFPFFGE